MDPRQKWTFTNIPNWKGLKPTQKDNALFIKHPQTVTNPPGWDNNFLNKNHVDEIVKEVQNPSSSAKSDQAAQLAAVKQKIAWNVAMGPVKSIPMNAFMMYMVGSQLGIFQIMMLGMSVFRILSGFFQFKNANTAFQGNEQKTLMQLFWVVGQLGGLLLCIWKCNSMGLLPTHPSDWLTFSQPAVPVEKSSNNYLWSKFDVCKKKIDVLKISSAHNENSNT